MKNGLNAGHEIMPVIPIWMAVNISLMSAAQIMMPSGTTEAHRLK